MKALVLVVRELLFGDDWRTALGIIFALALTALAARWIAPVATLALLRCPFCIGHVNRRARCAVQIRDFSLNRYIKPKIGAYDHGVQHRQSDGPRANSPSP